MDPKTPQQTEIIIDATTTEEVWKPIHGYEELYTVSNTGKVRKVYKTGKTKLCQFRQTLARTKIVHLSKKNVKKQFQVSKLVLMHFTDGWDFTTKCRHFTIRHKDENPHNCHISNLIRNPDDVGSHRKERENKMETDVDKWVASRPYVAYFYDVHGTRFIRFRRTWDPEDGGGKRQIDKTLKFDPTKQTNRVNRTFYDIRYAYRTWLIKHKMFSMKQKPLPPLHFLSMVNTNIEKKDAAAKEKNDEDEDEKVEYIDEAKEALENKLIVVEFERRPTKIGKVVDTLYTNEDFVEGEFSE